MTACLNILEMSYLKLHIILHTFILKNQPCIMKYFIFKFKFIN